MSWRALRVPEIVLLPLIAFLLAGVPDFPAFARSPQAITYMQLIGEMIPRLAALPGVASISPAADGRLELKTESGRNLTIGLANLFDAIKADPDNKEELVSDHLAAIEKIVAGGTAEERRLTNDQFADQLITVVKPLEFLETLEATTNKPGAPEKPPMIAEPMAGDILVMVGLDSEKHTQIMQSGSGKAYGMSDAQMAARALENLRKKAATLQVQVVGEFHGILFNDNYAASLIAVPQVWDTLATEFGGDLVVAVPERAMVMFVLASDKDSVAKLRAIAEEPDRPYPITRQLLIWHNSAWGVLE
jgi:uncharacterized protein YtpQ (UPF0354 family)